MKNNTRFRLKPFIISSTCHDLKVVAIKFYTKFDFSQNMRKSYRIFFLMIFAGFFNSVSAQVGFNNPNPDPSSLVDLTANDKGLLVPRMTTLQRMAIVSPASGLLVFDKNLNVFCVFDTVANPDKWVMLNPWNGNATGNGNVILSTTGNVGIGNANPGHTLEVEGSIKTTDTLIAGTGTFTTLSTTGNVNIGGTTTVHNLNVNGNARITDTIISKAASFSGTVTAGSFSGNGAMPSGAIILWYGTTAPAGWKICDGTNGTPDLRGRFVVGAGINGSPAAGDINPTYTVGATGGKNQHALAKLELPKHKHSVTDALTDNGQVAIAISGTNDTYPILGTGPGVFFTSTGGAEHINTLSQPTHTHAISGNTGDGTTDGLSSQPHENRPPYYVLTYIMKQ